MWALLKAWLVEQIVERVLDFLGYRASCDLQPKPKPSPPPQETRGRVPTPTGTAFPKPAKPRSPIGPKPPSANR